MKNDAVCGTGPNDEMEAFSEILKMRAAEQRAAREEAKVRELSQRLSETKQELASARARLTEPGGRTGGSGRMKPTRTPVERTRLWRRMRSNLGLCFGALRGRARRGFA